MNQPATPIKPASDPMSPAKLEGATKAIEALERRVEQLEAVIGSHHRPLNLPSGDEE